MHSRRNINASASSIYTRGYSRNQIDTADIVKETEEFKQELIKLEQSYFNAAANSKNDTIQDSGEQKGEAGVVLNKDLKDPKEKVDIDEAIQQLIHTNKATIDKILKLNEIISTSIKPQKAEISAGENAALKNKNLELRIQQMRWVKAKRKIDSLNTLLNTDANNELKWNANKDQICILGRF